MKLVPLRELTGIKTAELIKTVMEQPPAPEPGRSGGFNVEAVSAHARVLKALRKSVTPAGLVLEDGDHKALVAAIKAFRFGMATEDLDTVLTDIIEAKDPPAPANLVVEETPAAEPQS